MGVVQYALGNRKSLDWVGVSCKHAITALDTSLRSVRDTYRLKAASLSLEPLIVSIEEVTVSTGNISTLVGVWIRGM